MTPPQVQLEGLRASSATLSYLDVNVARRTGMTRRELWRYFDDSPFVTALMGTAFGNAAIITLPLTYGDMVRDNTEAVRYAHLGLDLARAMGVEHVSLAGLLASAMDYGNRLDTTPGYLTTGHATTAASVLRTAEGVLAAARRVWAAETVAVLGMGSIGQSTVTAALARLGNPRRLILVDLPAKETEVRTFGEQVQSENPGLEWSFDHPAHQGRGTLYDSTVIIGCTSTPNVLQVDELRPGCIVIDDSVPHCFDLARAFARAGRSMDLLLANGGLLQLPERFPVRSYAPALLHDSFGWAAGLDHGQTMPSCFLSPLLMTLDPALPPTLGLGVPTPSVLANLEVMERLGVTAPPTRCAGKSPSVEYMRQFANRFGTVASAGQGTRF